MTFTLDPAIEARLQRELAAGHYAEPSELLTHALDLIEAERADLGSRRAQIVSRLEESIAQAERSQTFSPEEVRARLAKQREAHPELSTPRR